MSPAFEWRVREFELTLAVAETLCVKRVTPPIASVHPFAFSISYFMKSERNFADVRIAQKNAIQFEATLFCKRSHIHCFETWFYY